jgi:hypothetical protein
LWFREARTGKAPGNIALGVRTTHVDRLPAGVPATFLRNLIIAAGSIAFLVGSVVVVSNAGNAGNAGNANARRQG